MVLALTALNETNPAAIAAGIAKFTVAPTYETPRQARARPGPARPPPSAWRSALGASIRVGRALRRG